MKRLYYLTRSIESAEQISQDLHHEGITDWHFHILSQDEAGLFKHHLHSANLIQTTDVIRFMERGAMIGLLLAVALLIPLMLIERFSVEMWLVASVFSLLFCIWSAGIGGISKQNYKISQFSKELKAGHYLIMVDVKPKDLDHVRRIMSRYHPEAKVKGVDSPVITPFGRPKTSSLS